MGQIYGFMVQYNRDPHPIDKNPNKEATCEEGAHCPGRDDNFQLSRSMNVSPHLQLAWQQKQSIQIMRDAFPHGGEIIESCDLNHEPLNHSMAKKLELRRNWKLEWAMNKVREISSVGQHLGPFYTHLEQNWRDYVVVKGTFLVLGVVGIMGAKAG